MSGNNKLAALRAVYADNQQGSQTPREQFTNKYYPFWNMKAGDRAVIRFLPDRDDTNKRGFMLEKTSHTLTINGQARSVPCLSMYGEDCPICKLSQDYYKANDKVNGKKFWRKKQYLAQALIVTDALPPDQTTGETHEGQVRHIALGYQLYNIIKEAFASDDELQEIPYSFEGGHDFVIKKTEQGEYSTYTMGSKFVGRQRDLTEEEIATAEADMIELRSLLPKNPGIEKVQAMLNAALNGEEYTEDAKPSGDSFRPAPSRIPARPSADEDTDPPFDVDTPPARPARAAAPATPAPAASGSADSDEVDAMLATIRARRTNRQ